jgi:hypothetical protein
MRGGDVTYLDRKARAEADAEIAQILELAEPFAWTDRATATGWFGQYQFDGIIKLPDPFRENLNGRLVRSEMLEQFERMLDVLGNAGWQPVQHFELTFSTDVRNFTQNLAGVLVEPSKQGRIALQFTLRLGRAR